MTGGHQGAPVGPWLGEAWRSLRFFQLFVFTLLALLLVPLQLRFRVLGIVLVALYLNAVIVALSARGHGGRLRWVLLAMGFLALGLRIGSDGDPGVAPGLYAASRLLVVVVVGGCVASALEYVLRGAAVSVDRIFAAITAYLLAALAFAAAYQAIAVLAPGSFSPTVPSGPGDELDRLEVQLMYFSFVTIATLGYGDVTPRLPLAQMLAVLEAVLGQFYVAVVIAWLVSTYAAHRRPGA